jgi:uncharacterized cupin superfamily protein
LVFLARAAGTNGSFGLMEEMSQRGKVTPLHHHPNCDESFYVLEGEIIVHIEGTDHEVGAGHFASAPRMVPHALMCTSATARVLTLITPGDPELEAFFAEVGEPATERRLPEPAPLPLEKLKAAAEKHGSVVLLGPPPFAVTPSSAVG